jgi:cell division protein FtsN
MKIINKILHLSLSIILISSCSPDKQKNPEVRFVDLQGNPKPIKTRVPEANAKIMSGQSNLINENSPTIKDEFKNNQKNISKNTIQNDITSSPNNSFLDNNPTYQNPMVKDKLMADGDKYQTENPVIEYDLSADDKNKPSSNVDDTAQEISLNDNAVSKKPSQVDPKDDLIEVESDIQENNNKNIFVKNIDKQPKNTKTFLTNNFKKKSKSSKVAKLYNSKTSDNIEKSNNANDVASSDVISNEDVGNSEESAIKGKFYVQVGAFSNLASAKKKLNLIQNQGKGVVLVGNLNNKKIYRSVFGPYGSKDKADEVKNKIIDSGNEAIIFKK